MGFQMNVRILKIPPVFDDPKAFSKGNMVFDEASILRSQSYFKWRYGYGWFKGNDDSQVFEWQKATSDGLFQINAAHVTKDMLGLDAIDHMELTGKKCPDHKTNT